MPQKSNINWSIEALNNFEDYVDWYLQNASIVVAADFVQIVEEYLTIIAENNHIARMVDEIPELREYVIQPFPYLISYWIKNQSEIIITSFLHQKMKK